MIKPPESSHRKDTMDLCFQYLQTIPNPVVLEFGMTRLKGNWQGDGYSTIHWAYYVAENNGVLVSVDVDPQAIVTSLQIIKEHEIPANNIILTCADAFDFMKNVSLKKVDCLYLDCWDYLGTKEQKDQSAKNHYDLFLLCEKLLPVGSYVLIDDMFPNMETAYGKGQLLIPYLLENKYKILWNAYQYLYVKE